MKFGGTSVGSAERILATRAIVAAHRAKQPLVVVSALAGVTNLLQEAIVAARANERDGVERAAAEIERRNRWAISGAVRDSSRRHDLNLAVDGLFEEMRQLLRSIRVLRELTPRATDVILSFGERLSGRIVTAAFVDGGLPAVWVEPVDVMRTDDRHGAAAPAEAAVARRAEERLVPLLRDGKIPVIGGFVGATESGDTTTLGRGGSDTSASVLGCAMRAEEIQIWSDVDGLMTADPTLVAGARSLRELSFDEAAELAVYGARVLHPAAVAPAVARDIPVRVLNSHRPESEGTRIVRGSDAETSGVVALASRQDLLALTLSDPRLLPGASLLPELLAALSDARVAPLAVLSGEFFVSLITADTPAVDRALARMAPLARIDKRTGRALVCLVGRGLGARAGLRREILDAIHPLSPELIGLGISPNSVIVVLDQRELADGLARLHRRFCEKRSEVS